MKSLDTAKPFSAKIKLLTFYILIWIISGLAMGINAYRFVPYYQNFVKNGIETEGKLTDISAGEFTHTIHYVYKVDGIDFKGKGAAGYGNPETQDLKKGDKVIVFYDFQNTGNSVPGNPELLLNYQIQYTWMSAIGGSMLMVIVILIARSGQKWIVQNGVQGSDDL